MVTTLMGLILTFCSAVSERNKNLSLPMKVFQSVIYALSKTKKPQTYIYPYKKIDTDKRLKPIQTFYLLQLMEIISIMKEKF